MTAPFDYPTTPHVRRHGPKGYLAYASYRDWLRDEFGFRCVYCLLREKWVPGGFHLDHFQPVVQRPSAVARYSNLRYACGRCNEAKGQSTVPDPLEALLAAAVEVAPDGSLVARTVEARRLVDRLGLDSPVYQEFRRTWMGLVARLAESHADFLPSVLGYPENLPNLKRLRPPAGNDRPEGISESVFERRRAGTLPATY
jgi:hypothetical protein